MYYLGLDIGTSSLKTTLMDSDQTIVYEAAYPYTIEENEPGFREIDPEIWFQAVLQGIQDVVERFDEADLACIGVTGQMHTTIFLDAYGTPVRKAIMWNDLRSASMVEPLREQLKQMKETLHIATILSTGSPAMNILWVKTYEPQLFVNVRSIMTAYDYIVYRLSGQYSADYCDASTSSLFDIVTRKWSDYMLNLLDIDESYLGPLHASCDVIGHVLPALCEKLKIRHPLPVIAGTGDNPANAVALGLLQERRPVISLGTSGVVIMVKADQKFDGAGKHVVFSAQGEQFVNIVQGTVRSAGGTHKWWVENIVESDDMAVDQARIDEARLGSNPVLFFPHISGDKLIYHNMNIGGAFIGLRADTKREDMTQAVFEGISFALREVLEHMQLASWPQRIQINGGGTKSALWMQIMADILHMELDVVSMNATPGYGACILAKMADDPAGMIARTNESKGVCYHPHRDRAVAYDHAYRKYQRMYQALQEIEQDESSA